MPGSGVAVAAVNVVTGLAGAVRVVVGLAGAVLVAVADVKDNACIAMVAARVPASPMASSKRPVSEADSRKPHASSAARHSGVDQRRLTCSRFVFSLRNLRLSGCVATFVTTAVRRSFRTGAEACVEDRTSEQACRIVVSSAGSPEGGIVELTTGDEEGDTAERPSVLL